MARFNLKSFAQPDLLKKIQPANLIPLLEPFRMFLEMKGFSLPSSPDMGIDAKALVWALTRKVDTRIEPYTIGVKKFLSDDISPLLQIVRREGIEIRLPV